MMGYGLCSACMGRLDLIWPHFHVTVRDDAGNVAVDSRVCAICVERLNGLPLVIPFAQAADWRVNIEVEVYPEEGAGSSKGEGAG